MIVQVIAVAIVLVGMWCFLSNCGSLHDFIPLVAGARCLNDISCGDVIFHSARVEVRRSM